MSQTTEELIAKAHVSAMEVVALSVNMYMRDLIDKNEYNNRLKKAETLIARSLELNTP